MKISSILITSILAISAGVLSPSVEASNPDPSYYAWGYNHVGQLGLGNTTSTNVPTPGFGPRFTQIVAGIRFACGLTLEGSAFCWGENTAGQLGSGDTNSRLEPHPVVGGHTFVSITAGAAHACAVTPTDSILCWGNNTDGQLGVGDTTDRLVPSLVPNSYSQVSAGIENTCALTPSGQAFCWGTGSYFGEPTAIGNGTLNSSTVPVAVTMPTGRTFVGIGVGWYSACALDDLGQAWCWGINGQGQLGTGDTTGRLIPTAVVGGVTFTSLSVGGSHRCGIAFDGSTHCWGDNTNGQLGIGSTANYTSPQPVTGGVVFSSVVAYSSYSCALTAAGIAYCWGENREGQLGRGTSGTTAGTTPEAVVGEHQFSRLAEGSRAGQFTFALPRNSTSAQSDGATVYSLELSAGEGARCSTSSISSEVGRWVNVPAASACSPSADNAEGVLLGWATRADFPVDIAQRQVDNGWGAYEKFDDNGRLTGVFIPAGGATVVTAPGRLHAIWSNPASN